MGLFEQLTDTHKHTLTPAPPTQAFVLMIDSLIQVVFECVCVVCVYIRVQASLNEE